MLMSVLTATEGVLTSVTIQWDRFLVDVMRDTCSILMRSVVMVSNFKAMAAIFVVCYYSDVDECALELDGCNGNATCLNTNGSFECLCDNGYDGDGFLCTGLLLC